MKKVSLVFLGLFALTSCNHKNKHNYKYTITKDNHLYIEIYRTSMLNSSVEAYLTDSVNFSQNLGRYDDEIGYINCTLQGDSVIVRHKEYAFGNSLQLDTMKTVGTKVFSLKALKKLGIFKDKVLPKSCRYLSYAPTKQPRLPRLHRKSHKLHGNRQPLF